MARPRFTIRGLLAVVASAGLGGSVGYLLLQSDKLVELHGGRGAFLGAALGALVALLAVGVAFAEHSAPLRESASDFARRIRTVLGVLVPLAVLAPIAFLLCLAVRA